jgi:transposase
MAHSSANSLLQRELLDTIKSLRTTIESLQATIEDLRKSLAESQERERLAKEEIETMKKRFFGRSSEKHMVQSEGQLDFFNEIELEADKQQEEEFPYEADPELNSGKEEKKRKPRTSRKEMFKGLLVEEEIIDLPEDQKTCNECGTQMEVVGQRVVRETLKFVPARLTVVRTIAKVYGCPKCKEDKANIVTPEVPDAMIPHSYASESVVVHAMYQKFVNAVPLYRQEKDWEQIGALLSRGTLGRWIKICSDEYFVPIYNYFHRLLLGREFAMADETRLQVLKEPERNPETDSFMWLFRSGEDGLPPLILYRYTETRAKFNAEEFLKGFKGYLMTDGYQGYNNLPDIVREACWAHIRRKFCDAIPAGKKDDLSDPAVQGVQYCDKLFAIERYCRENGYTHEQRHAFRNKKAPKILEAFWAWLDKQNPTKGSRMDKAVTYARNQKRYAETYLQDGRCSFSNNPSENSIRPLTVGRRNWLFCDTPGGAHASATVYTMVEMAKAHGLNVEKYLTFLLEKRPHAGMTDEELEKLTPWSEEARIYCGYAQQITCI